MNDSHVAPNDASKEVRLALVCYGGVSLAIYMHGVTKELYKLIRAARAFDRAFDAAPALRDVRNPFHTAGDDSERAYFDALVALARGGRPLTVVLDVIAGTSAGGINGVCLARGLAQGLTLDTFRDLWLNDGDMDVLLTGHALFPYGLGHGVHTFTKLLTSVGRLPFHAHDAPLNGTLMSTKLFGALRDMTGDGDPLVPADESLDLFVTATDVHGYDTAVATGAGGISHTDRSYRQLLHFHYDTGAGAGGEGADVSSDFGTASLPALAFAARATSSFPGAFPPVSTGTFAAAVGVPDGGIGRHVVYGTGAGASAGERWLMDGGVLDNGPFDHVIEAIAAKRASGPTAREIVYIEPDPGRAGDRDQTARPTFTGTIWASRTTIPWHTPLVGVLQDLRTMNTTIARVGAIVADQLPAVLAGSGPSGASGYDDLVAAAGEVRRRAKAETGATYRTYVRLRAEAVADAIAGGLARELTLPPDSNRAAFLGAVLAAWVRRQKAWRAADPDALEHELGRIDLPFRQRRAEFVLRGVNDLLAVRTLAPDRRAQLITMKRACWDLLTALRGDGRRFAAALRAPAEGLFGPGALTDEDVLADPLVFASAQGGRSADLRALYAAYSAAVAQTLTGSSRDLWETLRAQTRTWDEQDRAGLLSRYVQFPIWDALIFPVIALSDLPELSPISVQRFSPLDATCLTPVTPAGAPKEGKLDGVAFSHFGAFFSREWRENDYLWGRLDGAELVLRLLARHSGGAVDLTPALKDAFDEILRTEEPQLTTMTEVAAALTEQVGRIPAGALLHHHTPPRV